MVDDETLLRIKSEAQAELFRIPGVRAVAIGHKHVGGKNTGKLAILVKVDSKRPRADIAEGLLIPAEIEGIPTDVVQWKQPFDIGKLINDTAKERPLLGGTFIVAEFEDLDVHNPELVATQKLGTLGFIGKTTGTIKGIPAGGIVGVTCQHVISDASKKTRVGHKIGQPSTKECSACCFCCNDIIGKVLYGPDDSGVDVAIIALTKGLKFYNDIKGGIGAVNLPRVLKPSDVGTIVRKYGASTGLTQGTVKDVSQTVNLGSQSFADGQITIAAVSGTPVWDCCLCTDGTPFCGGGSDENFASFACRGDSGSAIVDAQNNIVGMLAQATCEGNGVAIGIDIITTAMGITVGHASAAKQTQGVPGISGINTMVGMEPEMVAGPIHLSDRQLNSLQQAHEELTATSLGHECAEVIHQHQPEVLQLVNTNRRVATVWQRNGGPEIVNSVLRMVQFRDQRLPTHIRGRLLGECLERIQKVFVRYGSAGLAAAMTQWGPRLAEFLGLSYGEMLATLKAGN